MSYTKAEQQEAREWLLRHLKPGMTVYTILRHVSKSGMSRSISLVVTTGEGRSPSTMPPANSWKASISAMAAARQPGCGMDMGFHLVYNLAARLWPEGFGCTGDHCQSNDHANGDRNYEPHNAALVAELSFNSVNAGVAANHWHTEGGYALRQRWM